MGSALSVWNWNLLNSPGWCMIRLWAAVCGTSMFVFTPCINSRPARPHPLVKVTHSRAREKSGQIKEAWLQCSDGCISALRHDCVCVCVCATSDLWSGAALVFLLEPDDDISLAASLRCSPHLHIRALVLRWAVSLQRTYAFKARCAANCYLCYQHGGFFEWVFGQSFTLDELGSIKIYLWSAVLDARALSSGTAWTQMTRLSQGKHDYYCFVACVCAKDVNEPSDHGSLLRESRAVTFIKAGIHYTNFERAFTLGTFAVVRAWLFPPSCFTLTWFHQTLCICLRSSQVCMAHNRKQKAGEYIYFL